MASRVNLSFKDPRTGLSFFYNVSEHVGPRPTIGVARTPSHEKVMKNSPDDVMLVQFFLRQICDASVERLPEPRVLLMSIPDSGFTINKICLGMTQTASSLPQEASITMNIQIILL